MANDDFCEVAEFNQYGFGGGIKYIFLNWSGRIASFASLFFFISLRKWGDPEHIYDWFLYIGLIAGLYYLILPLFHEKTSFRNKLLLLSLAAFIINILIIISYEFKIIFCINRITYYFPLIFICFSLGLLLRNKNNPIHYLAITICSFFIGSGSEVIGLIWLGFLLIYPFLTHSKKIRTSKEFIQYIKINKIYLTAFLFSLIFFIIMIVAPGNLVRKEQMELDIPFISGLKALAHTIYLFIFWHTPKNSLYFFLSIFPFLSMIYMLGRITTSKLFIKLIIPLVFSLLIIYFIPTAFVLGAPPPPRVYGPLIFTLFLISLYAIAIATKLHLPDNRFIHYFSIISMSLLIFHLADRIRIDYPEAKAYAISYDNRIELLEKCKNDKSTQIVILDPLYTMNSVLYQTAEIYNYDPENKIEKRNETSCFCDAKGYNFIIKIKEE